MRLALTLLTALSLSAAPAFADHDHGKKKNGQAEEAHDHGKPEQAAKTPEAAHGAMGEEMKMKADDHADHGTMSHGMDEEHTGHEMGDAADDAHSGHAMDSKTMPADGAVLKHSPKMIGMKFGHEMQVQVITLSTLTGEMIEIDISGVGKTDHVMVKAPKLQADDYIVDWRAKGHDGHIMSGSFSFTVE